jgi:ParB family chromosome partitioning protein
MLELALVENIQRKDLTPFEEAEAMTSLAQRCGYTHEDLAKRLGKSRSSVSESLALHGMPPDVRKVCRLAGITNNYVLLQVVRQGDPPKMLALLEKIASQGGTTREQLRQDAKKPAPGRPKSFTYNFKPPNKAFNLRLSFNKKTASKDEIIAALEGILRELRGA